VKSPDEAAAFLEYLKTPEAAQVIKSFGFATK
jgi:ABC-type molybdate transport system substrate-binding protein